MPHDLLPPATDAPLPDLPTAGPGRIETLLSIAAYFVLQLTFGMAFGGASVWMARHFPEAMPSAPDRLIVVVILTIACSAAVVVGLLVRRWGSLTYARGRTGLGFAPPATRFVTIASAMGVAAPVIGGLLTQFLAGSHDVSQTVSDIAGNAHIALRIALLPVVVLVGPFVEEVIFRGALLAKLRQNMGDGWAIAVSALVFGLVHLPDLDWLWYAVPNLMLVGVFCAWLRVRSGSIWPGVIAHAVNNALATVAWFQGP